MKTDEDIMKDAEKNLHEEFAMALNISPVRVDEKQYDLSEEFFVLIRFFARFRRQSAL